MDPAFRTQPRALADGIAELTRRRDVQGLVQVAEALPTELQIEHLDAVQALAFSLGMAKRYPLAVQLYERCWGLGPTPQLATSLAYCYYAWLMEGDRVGGRPKPSQTSLPIDNPQALRKAFLHWNGEALRLRPDSVKDLYRLGVFEAQLENRHDKVALRAFVAAAKAFEGIDPANVGRVRAALKYYARALYAGGRSALRLGELNTARRMSFGCIRCDAATDHVEPIHKFGLAGRVCLATGELDAAERAFRLALDAKGPPSRDYLFGELAQVCLARGHLDEAARWIEGHTRPERRDSSLWRLLGDIQKEKGDSAAARSAWKAALLRDRGGRHLTLTRLGDLEFAAGQLREAEQAYRQAIDFRRRRYSSSHEPAERGLAAIAEARASRATMPKRERPGPASVRPVPSTDESSQRGVS